jgi:thiamine monophosphate synthase
MTARKTAGKRVEIHVDRLVVHGLPAARGRAVAAAVQGELTRLAAQGGIDAGNARQAITSGIAGVAGAARGAKP